MHHFIRASKIPTARWKVKGKGMYGVIWEKMGTSGINGRDWDEMQLKFAGIAGQHIIRRK
jgi:hypothetical protein